MDESLSRRERLELVRVYLVVTPAAHGPEWEAALRAALETGLVGMVQLREKSATDDQVLARAKRLRRMADQHAALLILDDRVHLVADAGADGAHVGEADLAPQTAREMLGGDLLLGVSTHDAPELARAAPSGADHAGLGPCFASSSKDLERQPGGPALVRRCLPHAGDLPVFPIGGIGPPEIPALAAAGARRVAVGAGVLAAPDPADAVRRIDAALRGDAFSAGFRARDTPHV